MHKSSLQKPIPIHDNKQTKNKRQKNQNLSKLGREINFILIKNIYKIFAAKMILNGEKWSAFSLILGTK